MVMVDGRVGRQAGGLTDDIREALCQRAKTRFRLGRLCLLGRRLSPLDWPNLHLRAIRNCVRSLQHHFAVLHLAADCHESASIRLAGVFYRNFLSASNASTRFAFGNNAGWNLSVDFETSRNRVTPIVTLR